MDRRAFIRSVASGLLVVPLAIEAQSPPKMARLGFLAGFPRLQTQGSASTTIVDRLRELGYIEGRNLVVDFRYAETEERFRELANQLVATDTQVIYAHGPYALRAARAASAS